MGTEILIADETFFAEAKRSKEQGEKVEATIAMLMEMLDMIYQLVKKHDL